MKRRIRKREDTSAFDTSSNEPVAKKVMKDSYILVLGSFRSGSYDATHPGGMPIGALVTAFPLRGWFGILIAHEETDRGV